MDQNFNNAAEIKYANVSSDERTMAILCHVLSIFFWFIPALVIYLLKKDESPYVAQHAKEALNFQITLVIAYAVSIVLMILIIGVFMLIVVYFASIILCIIAAIKASDNVLYRYPMSIRFLN